MSTNNKGLVSVLMSAYNAEKYIEQAIKSILEQSYHNFEFLITDDCSTDKTKTLINSFGADKRISVYHNTSNLGYLRTINNLFEKCKGEYITFLDADDWSDARRLEIMVNAFEKDKDLGCVGCLGQKVSEDGRRISDILFKTNHQDIRNEILTEFNFIGAAIMVRNKVLADIGPYDLHFDRIGSEHLFWGGRIILKYKTINVPEQLYFYRTLTESYSSKNMRSVKGQMGKELALVALRKISEDNIDIFKNENKKLYTETMNYLFMKYNFWNDNFFTGLIFYLKNIGKNKMQFADKNSLLNMYSKKWAKNIFRPVTTKNKVLIST